jgi:hypothetical protein
LLEDLVGVLADRCEHPEPLAGSPQQVLVEQRLQAGDVGVGDELGGLERAAAAEDGQSGEEPLLVRREKVVRPGDRRPQRLLTRIGAAACREEVELLRDALQDLGGVSTLTRAAASSSASGRLSSRAQSSTTASSGSMRARAQNSSTASGSASAGTG